MPLKSGSSKKVIAENFHREKKAHPNMPHPQMIAIVLSKAGKDKPTPKKGK